ncbi:E3 ubiquitin-protein ligase ZNRF1 [Amia ocellicauda]|uniref:E3 ubiquitin-protein ligase ZNRF1 n=1 Tax=Amia ocellicauda TaxID=2972642 RepID=UPI003464B65E
MGTRASRFQQDAGTVFDKDGLRRDSYRRVRGKRPTSLVVDFSGSFDPASEPSQTRAEEGGDSDRGRSAAGSEGSPSPAERIGTEALPEQGSSGHSAGDSATPSAPGAERLSGDEAARVTLRTFSERLPTGRLSGRNLATRSGRVRGSHARPLSEAWVGVYRVNTRHGTIKCPFCTKPFPGGRFEEHLLSCLTAPSLPYNTDTLYKDSGECSICLEDLVQGQTIARLACLCIYHKSCIDSWCKVKPCCPEHPFD